MMPAPIQVDVIQLDPSDLAKLKRGTMARFCASLSPGDWLVLRLFASTKRTHRPAGVAARAHAAHSIFASALLTEDWRSAVHDKLTPPHWHDGGLGRGPDLMRIGDDSRRLRLLAHRVVAVRARGRRSTVAVGSATSAIHNDCGPANSLPVRTRTTAGKQSGNADKQASQRTTAHLRQTSRESGERVRSTSRKMPEREAAKRKANANAKRSVASEKNPVSRNGAASREAPPSTVVETIEPARASKAIAEQAGVSRSTVERVQRPPVRRDVQSCAQPLQPRVMVGQNPQLRVVTTRPRWSASKVDLWRSSFQVR